jgi:nucleoside-diphosphate-sugar epimerase
MQIAITGATGFIGHNLTNYLRDRGHNVIALARSAEKAQAMNGSRVMGRAADITDQDSLKTAFNDIEVVIHLAALFTNPECSWSDYYRVNVEGTKNVLEAAMHSGVRKVVHCSTVGVAMGTGNPPYTEKTPYSPPEWDKYETTKCEGEKLALDFHHTHGLPIVVIRPAQVYGPGDTRKAKFYRMVKRGIIVNPGKTLKHLIYIDDLCESFEMALMSDKAIGEIFIIAGAKTTALADLVDLIAGELGVVLPRIRLPATPITWVCAITEYICNLIKIKPLIYRRSMDFFTKSVQFDVTQAHTLLRFRSKVDVSTGVSRTAAWYSENGFL